MNLLLRAASYIFHPLWMPLFGSLFYFFITPRFFPEPVVKAKLLAIVIMTIFIPVVFFFMLKTLGKVSSHFLSEVRERPLPLLFYAALNFVILKYVLDRFDYPELYFFFLGILITALCAFCFVFLKQKVSLHLCGLGGVLAFVILLSLHFGLDLVYTISFLVAATGLTASSRLHYDAHNYLELLLGLLLGIFPQLGLGLLWL